MAMDWFGMRGAKGFSVCWEGVIRSTQNCQPICPRGPRMGKTYYTSSHRHWVGWPRPPRRWSGGTALGLCDLAIADGRLAVLLEGQAVAVTHRSARDV